VLHPRVQGRAFAKIRAYVASLPETEREPPSAEAHEAESLGLTVPQMRSYRELGANSAKKVRTAGDGSGNTTFGAARTGKQTLEARRRGEEWFCLCVEQLEAGVERARDLPGPARAAISSALGPGSDAEFESGGRVYNYFNNNRKVAPFICKCLREFPKWDHFRRHLCCAGEGGCKHGRAMILLQAKVEETVHSKWLSTNDVPGSKEMQKGQPQLFKLLKEFQKRER
jgi:hypothetical protein